MLPPELVMLCNAVNETQHSYKHRARFPVLVTVGGDIPVPEVYTPQSGRPIATGA